MKLDFLGTGAADWNGPDERGEYRRFTSTLIDGCLLIDVNPEVLELIPDKSRVTAVAFTHSHSDHFDIGALRALAPCTVYAHESWAGEIEGEGLRVVPLKTGRDETTVTGHVLTALPANHHTEKAYETPLHYLIERDAVRILYATDGAWMCNDVEFIAGERVLHAAVFDATIGDGFAGDYRIFGHNSIDMIRMMLAALFGCGRLVKDAPVFLTHMARTLHGTQAEIEAKLEKPLIAAYDGFSAEVIVNR